nr:HNH endonuclease family protein [uncultured Pseudokineococcus sp.]
MPARLVPALLAVVLATTGCGLLDGAAPQQSEVSGPALDVLATLEVRERDPRAGYDRELFGERWADVDGNGCDTRNDVLRRDLDDVDLDRRNGCLVWSGVLVDPYSGVVVDFERGPDTSPEVQVDHVVALSDAWQKGAREWDAETREAFANDPLNLLAVDGDVNEAKSDGDAATWLPPERSVRCAYVARQVAVKATYSAWVTADERDAVARVLADCPGEPVPAAGDVEVPALGKAS